MIDSLQDKLRKLKESKQLHAFKKSLTAFECYAFEETSEFPKTLNQAMQMATKIDTPRQSRITQKQNSLITFPSDEKRYLDSVVGDFFSWTERMFIESGIGVERFYLSTPFIFFPWVDCKVSNVGWVQNISAVYDLNISVISHDKTIFLSIENGEHWFDAYWCSL